MRLRIAAAGLFLVFGLTAAGGAGGGVAGPDRHDGEASLGPLGRRARRPCRRSDRRRATPRAAQGRDQRRRGPAGACPGHDPGGAPSAGCTGEPDRARAPHCSEQGNQVGERRAQCVPRGRPLRRDGLVGRGCAAAFADGGRRSRRGTSRRRRGRGDVAADNCPAVAHPRQARAESPLACRLVACGHRRRAFERQARPRRRPGRSPLPPGGRRVSRDPGGARADDPAAGRDKVASSAPRDSRSACVGLGLDGRERRDLRPARPEQAVQDGQPRLSRSHSPATRSSWRPGRIPPKTSSLTRPRPRSRS